MAVVNRVTMKYAVKGAKAAQRADRRVRETVRKTGRVARREARDIKAWLRENKKQIAAIGGAIAASVGVLLRKSPAMQVATSRIRFQFQLLAFDVGQKLKPAMDLLADGTEDVTGDFRDLDGASQNLILALSPLIGVATAVGLALAGVSSTTALVIAAITTAIGVFVMLTKAAKDNKRVIGLAVVALGTLAAIIAFGPGSVVAAVGAALLVLGTLVTMFDDELAGAVDVVIGWLGDFIAKLGDVKGAIDLSEAVQSMKDAMTGAINDHVIPAINSMIDAYNSTAGAIPGVDEIDKLDQIASKTDEVADNASRAADQYSNVADSLAGVSDEMKNVPTNSQGGVPVMNPYWAQPEEKAILGSGNIDLQELEDAIVDVEGFRHPALDLQGIAGFLRRSIDFRRTPKELVDAAQGTPGVGGTLDDPSKIVDIVKQVSGLHFQHGGVVPGSQGQEVPAVLHGGEVVLTPDQIENLGSGPRVVNEGDTTVVNVHEGAVQVDTQTGEGAGEETVDGITRRFRRR